MSNRLLAAVASKHGLGIDEHFGHAKQFWIYELADGQCKLIETRQVEHYCLGGTSSKTAMSGILETIKDCDAVFVAKIGDGPTGKLNKINVKSVSDYTYEEIKDSLIHYYRGQQHD